MANAIICDYCRRIQGPEENLEWFQTRHEGERRDFCCRQHLIIYEALVERAAQGTFVWLPLDPPAVVEVVLDWPGANGYRLCQPIRYLPANIANSLPDPIDKS